MTTSAETYEKWFIILAFTLCALISSCNNSNSQSEQEDRIKTNSQPSQLTEPEKKNKYTSTTQILLPAFEEDTCKYYQEENFIELIASNEILRRTLERTGSTEPEDEIRDRLWYDTIPKTNILDLWFTDDNDEFATSFLDTLIECAMDSIRTYLIYPLNTATKRLDSEIDSLATVLSEMTNENEIREAEKQYTKLLSEQADLMIARAGIVRGIRILEPAQLNRNK